MRTFCIILSLCIFPLIPNAQKLHLQKQKGYKYNTPQTFDSLKLSDTDFKLIDLEIRIWYSDWKVAKYNHKVTRIFKYKNGVWDGSSYSFFYYNPEHHDYHNIKIEQLIFKDSWREAWNKILSQNYLNLPDEEDLPMQEVDRFPTYSISEGEGYTIYILTKSVKRKIGYALPYEQLKYYRNKNIDCKVVEHFVDLISILDQEFSIDFK